MPSETLPRSPRTDPSPFRVLRAIDDGVFQVEQAVVATLLSAMTVMVFVDVVYRRLVDPRSKLGEAVHRFLGVELGPTAASVLGAVLGFAALWFAFWSADGPKRARGDAVSPLRPLVLAVVSSAGLGVLGWTMWKLGAEGSKHFYTLVFGLAGAGLLGREVRAQRRGWIPKTALIATLTIVLVAVAQTAFPVGYTWSKEISMIFLLWIGFLGASICVHEGKHLQIEALRRAVPPKLTRYATALGHLVAAAFALVMAFLGYEQIFDPMVGTYALELRFDQTSLPYWIATIAVPIAFGLTMLRFLGAMTSALLGGTYGMPVTEVDESVAAARAAATAQASAEAGGSLDDHDSMSSDDETVPSAPGAKARIEALRSEPGEHGIDTDPPDGPPEHLGASDDAADEDGEGDRNGGKK